MCAVLVSVTSPDRFKVAGFSTPGSQSARALALARQELGYDPQAGMVVVATAASRRGFAASTSRVEVRRLVAEIESDKSVGAVQSAFTSERAPQLLSSDGRRTLVLVHFRSTDMDAVATPINRLRAHLAVPGLQLAFTGYDVIFLDANTAAREDLVRAELIAFPLLALLVLIIFRGVVAAAVPLLLGLASVGATFACLRLLSGTLSISIFALDLALLLGLGLAVDYGLFLVSRYREEVLRSGHGLAALEATLATAGRTILFSGGALGCASAALLLFGQEFIYSMGIAGVLVSVFSVAAALLLAPPMLLLAGQRVGPRHRPPGKERASSWWDRLARSVMRHPADVALASALLLVAAAAPALRLVATFPDQSAVPRSFQSRRVADAMDRQFTPHLLYPVEVAVEPAARRRLPWRLLAASLVHTQDVAFAGVEPAAPHPPALVSLVVRDGPYSPRSQALVTAVRRARAPLLVGGNTAEFVDLKASIEAHLPLAVALVACTTLVALFLLTRSLMLALTALLLDALGLAAALGLLVLIFQDRVLGISGLVAYSGPSAIETTAAVVMLASTFGLTTDYSILLLSRIVEEHEAGAPDQAAVATAIERSGPVISSSAILLAVALLALTSSRVFLIKQLTVGQVLGILIDVSVVRLLLMPAMIGVLGRLSWWTPVSLGRRALARMRALW
ncbi:MAG: MMPL family transporter [Solirubrobacteraceae bacterium]